MITRSGTVVQGMLEAGWWACKRRTVNALGMPLTHLSGALAVAQRQAPAVAAFDRPTNICPTWVPTRLATCERDPAGLA